MASEMLVVFRFVGQFKQPGADDLLPSLIYAVLRANPANLHSNIEFIASFRSPSRLTSETRYFFTFLTSAVAWIHQVDHSYLSGISEQEFVDALQRSDDHSTEEEKEESSVEPEGDCGSTEGTALGEDVVGAEEEEESMFQTSTEGLQESLGDIPTDEKSFEAWRVSHFRFKGRTVETLTIDEVSQLLEEYNYLAGLIDRHASSRSK